MAGGDDNIMTTQEYVKKVNEYVSEDDLFTLGPRLSAVVYLHDEGVIASGCLGDVEKYCINGKLEIVVGVVMSCTPNALGDMTITLKDPTGIMGVTIHYKVFENKDDSYAKSIRVGYVNKARGAKDTLGILFWGVMAASTIPVFDEENLGDPINIRMDIIHPEPVAVVAFPSAAEELTALRFKVDIAKADNASLRARIKTTEAIKKNTHNRERQARIKIEQQLAAVQESQCQDREDFRKLKELVIGQFRQHS
ncbi:reverse transcriptase domain-containing protein [Tanacetum coccineum]